MIERKYQTFWPRFFASCIDGIIFVPLSLMSWFIWKNYQVFSPFLLLCWHTISSFLYLIYSVVMHGKFGQTLGKMATKVKVLDVSEMPFAMAQAVRRDIIPLVLTLIGVALDTPKILSGANLLDPSQSRLDISEIIFTFSSVGWLMTEMITMLFSKKRRALHDFIAGSVVVRLDELRRN